MQLVWYKFDCLEVSEMTTSPGPRLSFSGNWAIATCPHISLTSITIPHRPLVSMWSPAQIVDLVLVRQPDLVGTALSFTVEFFRQPDVSRNALSFTDEFF